MGWILSHSKISCQPKEHCRKYIGDHRCLFCMIKRQHDYEPYCPHWLQLSVLQMNMKADIFHHGIALRNLTSGALASHQSSTFDRPRNPGDGFGRAWPCFRAASSTSGCYSCLPARTIPCSSHPYRGKYYGNVGLSTIIYIYTYI